MRFETGQHMRVDQQMKLAPRMIQSMEILQMPLLALQERIEQELESNIALEQVEPGDADGEDVGEGGPDGDGEQRNGDVRSVGDVEGADDGAVSSDGFERLSEMESSYRESFEYESETYRPGNRERSDAGGRDAKMDALASLPSRDESLTEQLQHQWALAEVEPEMLALGERLIEYINEDGLMGADAETICQQLRREPAFDGLTEEQVERGVRELQFWLEPAGVGGRSAKEALLLQVDDRLFSEEDEHEELSGARAEGAENGECGSGGCRGWVDVRELIDQHYGDLLENRIPRIAEQTGWPLERVQSAMQLMRKLTPHPGRLLVNEVVSPVIPDVVIEYDEQSDEYVAGFNDGLLPTLQISKRYQKMARDRQVESEAREFAADSVRSATWLIEAVHQRRNTLLRVVNAVIARQRDYFDKGPQYLRPMPMIDVADQLGVHVATVSRAVSDKWARTPRGIVPLRMFFSGGTSTDSGEQMSWEAVRATLKEIIANEDPSHPFSDEALAQELKQRGIDIARRTVVKYRQQLDIPPARRRKVFGAEKA